jgi:transcription elongation factor Elf1
MDSAISFDNHTCPRCGKGILQSKKVQNKQQYSTIDSFVCTECGLSFPIHWILSGDEYKPYPLYMVSSIENFKKLFYNLEEDLS